MTDWVDEILEIEPGMQGVPRDSLKGWFDENYDSIEEVWDDVSSRDHEENSFRLPVKDDDRLNCLGRTIMVGLYNELLGDGDAELNIYYNEKFDHENGGTVMKRPHVTASINGTEYGRLDGYKDDEQVPLDAMEDVYKVGLGFTVLELGEDIEGVNYDQLEDWGNEIWQEYDEETPGPDSSYLHRQGHAMKGEAREEKQKKSMGGSDTDIYFC